MANKAREILDKAKVQGIRIGGGQFLQMFRKDERGVPQPTGPKKLKKLRDETKLGEDFRGVQRQELHTWVEDEGQEKLWVTPVFKRNDDGTYDKNELHYLIPALAQIEDGEWFIAQGRRKGKGAFVEVSKVVHEGVVNLDEHGEEIVGELPKPENIHES